LFLFFSFTFDRQLDRGEIAIEVHIAITTGIDIAIAIVIVIAIEVHIAIAIDIDIDTDMDSDMSPRIIDGSRRATKIRNRIRIRNLRGRLLEPERASCVLGMGIGIVIKVAFIDVWSRWWV
jgi:hypothetical protein